MITYYENLSFQQSNILTATIKIDGDNNAHFETYLLLQQ